jgi:hypothetical protein
MIYTPELCRHSYLLQDILTSELLGKLRIPSEGQASQFTTEAPLGAVKLTLRLCG